MSGDQETLQKQLQEALEGQRRAEEEKLRAEAREKKLEEQLKARENLEGELKKMRGKKDSGCRLNTIVDFASPGLQLSDVILLVGKRKIHANRMYLAHYCEYFKVIFCNEFAEKNKKEIELKDIDPDEFEEMLRVIYPQRKKPSAATVTGLLRMADFFDVNVIRVECSDFLLASTDFSFAAKILLSEEFHLVELQFRLVESLKNAVAVKAIIGSEDFGKLSEAVKNSLLDKYYCLTDGAVQTKQARPHQRAKRTCAIL